jgi:hypothetical protein
VTDLIWRTCTSRYAVVCLIAFQSLLFLESELFFLSKMSYLVEFGTCVAIMQDFN